jgi:hypothetical protein
MIREPETVLDFQEIAVELAFSGSMENIVKWLSTALDPEKFRVCRRLSLKPTEASDVLEGNVIIATWGRAEEARTASTATQEP